MPRNQVAAVANYDFGAPVAEAEVLRFKVIGGGKLELLFEAVDAENDITVSAQVSADGTSPADTTASDNGEAVVDEVVKVHTDKSFTVNMRASKDNYLHILASGGARGRLQIRGRPEVEIISI